LHTPDDQPRLKLFLADFAQVSGGKLYVIGGGWKWTLPPQAPIAIAGLIEVPWGEANRRKTMSIVLQTADGQPVSVPTPMGEAPFQVEVQFEVGRPVGLPAGLSQSLPIAIVAMRPTLPVGTYEFRVSVVDGPTDTLIFAVVSEPLPGSG
jgi:hypothetical protein